MDRYTRKDAEAAFGRLCEATGHHQATAHDDVRGWELDYNSVYGGFVVNQVINDGGGVTQPFGSMRRSARAFCESVHFALRVLEQAR